MLGMLKIAKTSHKKINYMIFKGIYHMMIPSIMGATEKRREKSVLS